MTILSRNFTHAFLDGEKFDLRDEKEVEILKEKV